MTLARIEMVLRLVGGVIAALAVSEVARNFLTPTPALFAPWPYLLSIIIGIIVAVGVIIIIIWTDHIDFFFNKVAIVNIYITCIS